MADMIASPERTYTIDEFWDYAHLPENAGRRFELVNGEIREMVPAGGEHGEIGGDFFGLIWTHNKKHHLGRVTAAETGYVLGIRPDGKPDVRAPNVGFVSIERAPKPFGSKFIPLVPDLAVEIVSPGDEAWEIEEKVLDYLRYGVRLVWVVYPASRTIISHTHDQVQRLAVDDLLDGGDVLPGFTIKVSDIFPK